MSKRYTIKVRGKQRKDIDVGLMVQAVIALGHQLAEEERQTEETARADTPRTANQDEQEREHPATGDAA